MAARRRAIMSGPLGRSAAGLPAIREVGSPLMSLEAPERRQSALSPSAGPPRPPIVRAHSQRSSNSSLPAVTAYGRRVSLAGTEQSEAMLAAASAALMPSQHSGASHRSSRVRRMSRRLGETSGAGHSALMLRRNSAVRGAPAEPHSKDAPERMSGRPPGLGSSSERKLASGRPATGAQPHFRRIQSARGAPFGAEIGRNVMQGVNRLPELARNVGGRIIDGGQQVFQGGAEVGGVIKQHVSMVVQGGSEVVGAIVHGGQQVAVKVADTIKDAGHEVKDKVVEGTEAVIAATTPAVKHSLKTMAWKVTELLRKRKAGDKPQRPRAQAADAIAAADTSTTADTKTAAEGKPPKAGKKKKEGELAPKVLMLSLHNSLAANEEEYICRVSLFADFWVDNRTGYDLVFRDLDAPPIMDRLPFLIWYPVRAPGHDADARAQERELCNELRAASAHAHARDAGGQRTPHDNAPTSIGHDAGRRLARTNSRRPPSAPAALRPALLNDQARVQFRVDDGASKTDFSVPFKVTANSQKFEVVIKAESYAMTQEEVDALLAPIEPMTTSGQRRFHVDPSSPGTPGALSYRQPSRKDRLLLPQQQSVQSSGDTDITRHASAQGPGNEAQVPQEAPLLVSPRGAANMEGASSSPPELQLPRLTPGGALVSPSYGGKEEVSAHGARRFYSATGGAADSGAPPQQWPRVASGGGASNVSRFGREGQGSRTRLMQLEGAAPSGSASAAPSEPLPLPGAGASAAPSGPLPLPGGGASAAPSEPLPASSVGDLPSTPPPGPPLEQPDASLLPWLGPSNSAASPVAASPKAAVAVTTGQASALASTLSPTAGGASAAVTPALASIAEPAVEGAAATGPRIPLPPMPINLPDPEIEPAAEPADGLDAAAMAGIAVLRATSGGGGGGGGDGRGASSGSVGRAPRSPRGLAARVQTAASDEPQQTERAPRTPSLGSRRAQEVREEGCMQQQQKIVHIRRMYQFSVEVWPAPNSTVFRRTKVITVKNKYLILNATGLTIEYKQKGTPDPDRAAYGVGPRFSGKLPHNWRAAWHWDDAHADQELMIRPATDRRDSAGRTDDSGNEWEWSGSFKLPEHEDYFGLRIRHRDRREYVIIPVNISVGAAGSVLVTLKSKESVPPYMIVNRCRDVVVRLKQADWPGRPSASARDVRSDCGWDDWDEIPPNALSPMPFAWDEPRLKHSVKVVASVQKDAFPPQATAVDVDLDAVDANTTLFVQSRPSTQAPPRYPTAASRIDARGKLKYVSDNAKKVYVMTYADGPTRVLCFSEDRSGAANADDENSLVNLSYRLAQAASRLKEVEYRLHLQLGDLNEQTRAMRALAASSHPGGSAAGGGHSSHPTGPESVAGASSDMDTRPHLPGPSAQPSATLAAGKRSGWSVAARAAVAMKQQQEGSPAAPTSGGARYGSGGNAAYGSFLQVVGQLQRVPSMGMRQPAGKRMLSGSGAGPGSHHARTGSGHGNVPPGGSVAGADDLPPLLLGAPVTGVAGGAMIQLLESTSVYGAAVDVPIGGDLALVLRYVEGLTSGFRSNEKLVSVEAKMTIILPKNAGVAKEQRDDLQATASWQQYADGPAPSTMASGPSTQLAGMVSTVSGATAGGPTAPRVDLRAHEEVFRDITASAELQVEFYVVKGTVQQKQAPTRPGGSTPPKRPAEGLVRSSQGQHPGGAASYGPGTPAAAAHAPTMRKLTLRRKAAALVGQFAGTVRIPLLSTLGREKTQEWRCPLERRVGSQTVRGYLVASFEWSVTNEGMLMREVAALEHILAEKLELLALLNPLPTSLTAAFVRQPGSMQPAPTVAAARVVTEQAAALGGSGGGMTNVLSGAQDPLLPDRPLSLGSGGASLVLAHEEPERAERARAISESYSVNLEVSILEVMGLLPREGVRADIAATLYGLDSVRQAGGVVSTGMLPRAVVVLTCAGETHTASADVNSVHPRFPKNTCTFANVPLGSRMHVSVMDRMSKSYSKLLAEAEMLVSDIPGTDPVYAWMALPRRKRHSRSQNMLALLMVLEEEGETDVQLLARIKIHKPQVHGVLASLTLDLAGVGLCAKTNLEELFNFTLQQIRSSLVQARTDLQVSVSVQTIQLDNQMLEAHNPVVLAPADPSQTGSAAHARRRHKARLQRRALSQTHMLRFRGSNPAETEPLLSFEMVYSQAKSNQAMMNTSTQQDNMGILSFQRIVLELGPMDFSADQEFIEAVISYLHAIPFDDFHQDGAWQKQVDAMQGGGTASTGAGDDAVAEAIVQRERSPEEALAWLLHREAAELELLRGQSSTWFYLEEFYLSDIFINVTLALNSTFSTGANAGGRTPAAAESQRQRSMLRGFVSRVSGGSGFQLINVTNAPIQLEYVQFQNRLVNRVSLVNTLWRHYSWIALAQARKVLGGAGPAIAAIPASVVWASLALIDLGSDVAAKRVRAYQVPARIGYVMLTLTGQVIGVFSRTMVAVMAMLPPRFSSDTANFSDSEATRRFDMKPQTVLDALYLAQRDVIMGFLSGAFGIVHDPTAGSHWSRGFVPVGVTVGLLKATLGLAVRPAAGAVEATSKMLQGVGLVCLGKRGIQGKLVRRVQNPGVAITDVLQAARASAAQEAYHTGLITAWQAALSSIAPSLEGDRVVDVVAARPTRVVLLTNLHLVYLYARRHAASTFDAAGPSGSGGAAAAHGGTFTVSYRVKWIIKNDHIDNIRGIERGNTISVEFHKPVTLGRLSLKLPLRRGMRTSTAEGHKNLIFRLNRHIGVAASDAVVGDIGGLTAAAQGSAGAAVDVQDLRISG